MSRGKRPDTAGGYNMQVIDRNFLSKLPTPCPSFPLSQQTISILTWEIYPLKMKETNKKSNQVKPPNKRYSSKTMQNAEDKTGIIFFRALLMKPKQ